MENNKHTLPKTLRWTSTLIVAVVALLMHDWATATTIQTYGGNLIPNGTATNIGAGASGVAVDSTNRVYVADASNHTIRRIDPSTGISTVIAGTGASGFSGDGGAATSARLNSPKGVALDSSGNLYIADTSNHRIRKIDSTTGNISTIAGTGTGTFGGDGAAASAARVNSPQGVTVDSSGNVYIADTSNNRVRKITASTGNISTAAGNGTGGYLADNVAATGTRINQPRGVVVDSSGNLYIADTGNNRIRKVDTGGTITTYAGTGTASFSGDNGAATSATIRAPQALTLDSSGNMYIADTTNHRVRKISGGIITTLTGTGSAGYGGDNGVATSGQISSPAGIAVDSAGNIYIGDTGNSRLRKIGGGTITTFQGTGSATYGGDGGPVTNAQFTSPQTVVFDGSGNRYISDSGSHRIRKVDSNGTITTIAGTGVAGFSGDNGPAVNAQINTPLGIALDASGNIYIADGNNNRVRKVNITTGIMTTVAGDGTGSFGGDNGPATSAQIFGPFNVKFDTLGNMYIADTGNNRLRKVGTSGTITTVVGNGTAGYSGDNGPATSAQLNTPIGLFLDSANNIYFTDYSNGSVRKVVAGTITTVAGNGANGYGGDGGPATSAQLNSPRAVAVDAAGNIFITDGTNNRIRKVDITTGNISTFAGDGNAAFSGDGGPAASAQVSTPQGITVVGTTGILISDTGNRRLRLITYADTPGAPTSLTVAAGDTSAVVSFSAPASNGGASITSYTVSCTSSDGGVSGSATGTSSPITVSSLTNGKTYTCSATATNAAPLTSAASAASNVFSPAVAALAIPTGPIPSIASLPFVSNFSNSTSPLNLSGGQGPTMLNCLLTTLGQALGGSVVYQGQSANGVAQITWNGQTIAFYPLTASTDTSLAPGVRFQSGNLLSVVTSCGTFNTSPAVYDLTGIGALLNGMGIFANINDQGVITAWVNGTYYVVRPDYLVTPGTPGTASLILGADGFLHYTGSNGNSQLLRPAFVDATVLQNQLSRAMGIISLQIQMDGSALLTSAGRQYTLVPDMKLSEIPAEHVAESIWQDGPNHYSFMLTGSRFPNYVQGFTVQAGN